MSWIAWRLPNSLMLWQDCRFEDPQSAQLIEAYLDRIYPSLARGHGARRGPRWAMAGG